MAQASAEQPQQQHDPGHDQPGRRPERRPAPERHLARSRYSDGASPSPTSRFAGTHSSPKALGERPAERDVGDGHQHREERGDRPARWPTASAPAARRASRGAAAAPRPGSTPPPRCTGSTNSPAGPARRPPGGELPAAAAQQLLLLRVSPSGATVSASAAHSRSAALQVVGQRGRRPAVRSRSTLVPRRPRVTRLSVRTASPRGRRTAAAVATLSESTPAAIGIRTRRSAAASASGVSPGPSAPSSSATRVPVEPGRGQRHARRAPGSARPPAARPPAARPATPATARAARRTAPAARAPSTPARCAGRAGRRSAARAAPRRPERGGVAEQRSRGSRGR